MNTPADESPDVETLQTALDAYNQAVNQWNKTHPDARDEPRNVFAVRAVVVAITKKANPQ